MDMRRPAIADYRPLGESSGCGRLEPSPCRLGFQEDPNLRQLGLRLDRCDLKGANQRRQRISSSFLVYRITCLMSVQLACVFALRTCRCRRSSASTEARGRHEEGRTCSGVKRTPTPRSSHHQPFEVLSTAGADLGDDRSLA